MLVIVRYVASGNWVQCHVKTPACDVCCCHIQAFQVSAQFTVGDLTPGSMPGKHQQLVISALRALGPVLTSDGCVSLNGTEQRSFR